MVSEFESAGYQDDESAVSARGTTATAKGSKSRMPPFTSTFRADTSPVCKSTVSIGFLAKRSIEFDARDGINSEIFGPLRCDQLIGENQMTSADRKQADEGSKSPLRPAALALCYNALKEIQQL
jgi:hypothetical protein